MIVTVTPNPSIDRTVTLSAPLTRGAVHRVTSVTTEPGGKGVNVARALTLAGLDAVAVLPAPANDPLMAALTAAAVPFSCVPTAGRCGPTSPSPNMTAPQRNSTNPARNSSCRRRRADPVRGRQRRVGGVGCAVRVRCRPACRTAGTPTWSRCSPRIRAASRSTPPTAADGTRRIVRPRRPRPDQAERRGTRRRARLLRRRHWKPRSPKAIRSPSCRPPASWSTGACGRCSPRSAPRAPCWSTRPAAGWPPRRPSSPRSTVGAGDASLAGYLRAEVGGAVPPQRLQMAVAYGSAAAALPGSALPTPAEINLDAVQVSPIAPISPTTNTKVSP